MLKEFNISAQYRFNTMGPRQNNRQFADDLLKWIFLNKDIRISIKFSLKSVSNVH